MSLPIYLGGHANKTHLDEALLKFLVEKFDIKSYLDVGCGPGGMVKIAEGLGLNALGIDGDFKVKKVSDKILIHDFCSGPATHDFFDLGWSVEFLEHVWEKHIPDYMPSFQKCKYVFCTHAVPNQTGHHHVNCQDDNYWIEKFREYGFEIDEELTRLCRERSGMKREFVKQSGLFFRNVKI